MSSETSMSTNAMVRVNKSNKCIGIPCFPLVSQLEFTSAIKEENRHENPVKCAKTFPNQSKKYKIRENASQLFLHTAAGGGIGIPALRNINFPHLTISYLNMK